MTGRPPPGLDPEIARVVEALARAQAREDYARAVKEAVARRQASARDVTTRKPAPLAGSA